MNYPVWYLPETGGGFLIGLISILHVFVSHFAVGGGLYLIYAEKKGLRENSQQILDFTKKHARFFYSRDLGLRVDIRRGHLVYYWLGESRCNISADS